MTLTELPGPLRAAVWLLGAEALAVAAGAGLLGYQAITGEPADVGSALSLAGFTLLVAAVLAGLVVALARRKARARAPAIVLQLIGVMSAVFLMIGGEARFGVPIAVLGVAVATLLLAPSTDTALR